MSNIEVVASPEGMTIKLNGDPIAVKRGRKAWVNMEGQKVNPRRWPAVVRAYAAIASASYVLHSAKRS